jgi:hypothetical protein
VIRSKAEELFDYLNSMKFVDLSVNLRKHRFSLTFTAKNSFENRCLFEYFESKAYEIIGLMYSVFDDSKFYY